MFRAEFRDVLRHFFIAGVAVVLSGARLQGQPAASGSGLLTPEESNWLQRHPNVRLAPSPDYQPVEFFDAAGNYAGMTADYFRLIEQRLGYHFKVVQLTPDQWLQLNPDLRGADVIPASAATPKREEFWSYTRTFLELPAYVITREKEEDDLTLDKLGAGRVAVVAGWAAEEFLRTTHTNLVVVPVANPRAGLQEVSFGLVDAFVSELPVATAWMEREGFSNLKASAEAGYTYRLSISVRKDWPELRAILDKALATITPEERHQILDHWVKLKTPGERRLEKIRRRLWWSAGGLVGLLAAVLLWNRLLVWRVRARTEEVHLSEEKFSKAFRASPDGLAISELETGRYIEINEGYCRLFAFTRAEMLGHTSVELGIWENPADRERLVSGLKERGEVRNLEMHMRTRQGESRIILLSADEIEISGKSCLVSVLHDVTDRVRAERALRKSEEKFSKAFRASPDGLGVSELESGRFIAVNDGYCKLYGFSREEMLGRTSVELGIWSDPRERACFVEKLKASGSISNYQVHARTRAGSDRLVLLSAEAIELEEKACAVFALHDITERKQAEAEREEAIVREQEARIEYTLQLIAAQEAERKRIAAELHDSMGQNLLLIKNLAQLALKSGGRESVYEQVATISHLATQCIAEARQISRDLHPYQLDHLGLKRSLEAMLENAAQATPVQLTWKFELVDDLFRGDAATNLYRIVQESVNNILKHSAARRADFRLERDIHEVQLRIEDDGVGFDLENAAGKKGLGLKNMSDRVRMLGGKWNMNSTPGRGTTITVTIPVAEKAG
jgi:PAS domain S-box-containing protein